MELLQGFFGVINDLTWGWALVPFLVVMGLFFTIFSSFVQFRYFKRMFRVLSGKLPPDDPKGISGREALLVSVGGRVGGGNIAGVAVAISIGGPGAVFWMWAIALVGMATSVIECSLAQLYKERAPDGSFRGGPARSIIHGLGRDYRWLAIVYAVCLLFAFSIGFNAFQGNTVAGAVQDSLGIDRLYSGIVLSILTLIIIYGGIRRIAKVADVVVPVMALGYLLMAAVVILINLPEVPGVLISIVRGAFGLDEAIGGGMGIALAQGLRRGLFSNEAGLGSVPNVAATADVRHPVSQGITQSLSVFIDTILICTCTALVILLGDVYVPGAESIDGVALTQQSLVGHVGGWAAYFLTGAVLLFALSSIIVNYYLGENALSVFTDKPIALHVLRFAIVGIVFLGAVAPGATAVFVFSDPMMGILAVINLLALMMLFPIAKRLITDFGAQLKAGVERPVLDPAKYTDLDIDREVWTGQVGPDAPSPGTSSTAGPVLAPAPG